MYYTTTSAGNTLIFDESEELWSEIFWGEDADFVILIPPMIEGK